jgi:hypothetical protein
VGAISFPSGVQLLRGDGLSPPDLVRADLANASPAQLIQLASESVTLQTAASLMIVSDSPIDTADLSARAVAEVMVALSGSIRVAADSYDSETNTATTGNTFNLLA